jgi:hypothetical protein
MQKLTGYGETSRRIDGVLRLVEYVRDSNGVVWARVKGGKWAREATQDLSAPDSIVYKGVEWCVHPHGLELKTKLVRLPKV